MADKKRRLLLSEAEQNRVDEVETLQDVAAGLGASEDDLSVDKDQHDQTWLHHAVDETGKELRLIGTELAVHAMQTLQTNGETQIDGGHNILEAIVAELDWEAQLL